MTVFLTSLGSCFGIKLSQALVQLFVAHLQDISFNAPLTTPFYQTQIEVEGACNLELKMVLVEVTLLKINVEFM